MGVNMPFEFLFKYINYKILWHIVTHLTKKKSSGY